MSKLVIDMMGSDQGCQMAVEAVKMFKKNHPEAELVLVGKKEEIGEIEGCKIIDARDVVAMETGALQAIRMKESSMYKACKAVTEEGADGVVSAGGTGSFLTLAVLLLKKIPGITRPALVTSFPTKVKGKKVVLLDCGASNENTPEELANFGLMGSLFSKSVFGTEDPKVYLISNGTEEGKGSPVGKEAYKLMKDNKTYTFKGNMEAREVMSGEADVIVCDGFTGNVLLKTVEGVASFMGKSIKGIFTKNLWSKLGYLHVKKDMRKFTKMMSTKEVGGALLLGVNGAVCKAHGNSDSYAFFKTMELALGMADHKIVDKIKEGLEETHAE